LASLRFYFNKKINWRKEHPRKCPCASFIYFGNADVSRDIFNLWIEMKQPRKEEAVLAKYTDINDELDMEYYKKYHEPKDLFILKNHSPYKDINRDTIFKHKTGNKED
jgi:hypothetical protein